MVVRRIQMYIEVWDRTALGEQEKTFGRHRDTGAPLGLKNEFDTADFQAKDEHGQLMIPVDSHMSLVMAMESSKFYAELIRTLMGWIRKQEALMQDYYLSVSNAIRVSNLSRCKNGSLKTIS